MGIRREPGFILFGEGIDHYNWRGVKWFVLTYFGAFLVAALIAPVIYLWIQGMETPANPDSVIAYLQSKPISKYVDRVRLLGVVITMIWLIGACRLWGRFGFHWSHNGFKALGGYFLLGVLSLSLVVDLQAVFLDPVVNEPVTAGGVMEIMGMALLGGLIIGWVEEAIFRGLVLRMFYSAMKPLVAVLLSAAVFAAVHFKSVPNEVGMPFTWYSGFLVAGYQSVSVFLTVEVMDFLNLFLAGVVLNLVFLRTGSLVGCMGIHAGWVLVKNTWSDLVEIPESPATRILGTEGIVDGYASFIILVILSVTLYVNLIRHQKKSQVGMAHLS
jgi:membrane protease YdiL (CAAX protease family)